MKTTTFFVVLLFVMALAALLFAIFSQPNVAEQGEFEQYLSDRVRQEVPQPVVSNEPEKEIWTTSKRLFTVEIPSSFSIGQEDSGSISMVTISEADADEQLVIVLGSASTLSGVPILLDTWINEQLLTADKIEDCDSALELKGVETTCFKTTTDDRVQELYFGTADTLTHFYVAKDVEVFRGTLLQTIFKSIDFNPTVQEVRSASVIE